MTDNVGEIVTFREQSGLKVVVEDGQVVLRLGLDESVKSMLGIEYAEVIVDPQVALKLSQLLMAKAFEAAGDERRR